MNIVFKDRFNRKRKSSHYINGITYQEYNIPGMFSRNNLPASFWLDGDIYWENKQHDFHCTTGPACIYINGVYELEYWLNGNEVTAMEALLV